MDAFVVVLKSLVVLPVSLTVMGVTGTKFGEFCGSSTPHNKCIGANKTDGYRVACSGGFRDQYLEDGYSKFVQSLMLCHWPLEYFDPIYSLQTYHVSNLTKLTITKSDVRDIIGEFPSFLQNLKTLNLSRLSLERVKPSAFKHLSSLEVLDLSYNKLYHLHSSTVEYLPKLKQIWLAGSSWICKNDLFWLLNVLKDSSTFKVMDSNRMVCGGFQHPGKPVVPILRLLNDLEKECPSGSPDHCVCTLDYVSRGLSAPYIWYPAIKVDCSYRDMKTLPKKLPHNTTTLLVQGNQISTLDELVTNRYYAKLSDIYLDYNRINSISILEGSRWLDQCRVLSLKGNNLTKIPTYAFDNAFQRYLNIIQLYLGDNPWRCDCLFAPAFQDLLIKYEFVIMDKSDIKCSYQQDDEYYLTPILELPRNTLCRSSTSDMITFWDSLNVLLASMIVLVILKFIYDLIIYKKYGRLPWIITLLP